MTTTVSFNVIFDKMMKDPEFRKEYEALAPEFELKRQLIKARIDSKMTQEQIAQKNEYKTSQSSKI